MSVGGGNLPGRAAGSSPLEGEEEHPNTTDTPGQANGPAEFRAVQ